MYEQVVPPSTHDRFVEEFPLLAEAWSLTAKAGEQGPIDAETARVIKLAIALAAGREGAVRASVRKAKADGISKAMMMQVLGLCAGTIGFPATAAGYNWVISELKETE